MKNEYPGGHAKVQQKNRWRKFRKRFYIKTVRKIENPLQANALF